MNAVSETALIMFVIKMRPGERRILLSKTSPVSVLRFDPDPRS